MDHNDVRKGILQANMIERNSGLLSAEMTIVPVSYTHLTLPTTPYV